MQVEYIYIYILKIWLTPWGIIHHESCLWHLGSNRALELVKTFHLYRYGSLRKKHQWRDRLVAVGIYPSHTGCFGLPDLHGSGAAHVPVAALVRARPFPGKLVGASLHQGFACPVVAPAVASHPGRHGRVEGRFP